MVVFGGLLVVFAGFWSFSLGFLWLSPGFDASHKRLPQAACLFFEAHELLEKCLGSRTLFRRVGKLLDLFGIF